MVSLSLAVPPRARQADCMLVHPESSWGFTDHTRSLWEMSRRPASGLPGAALGYSVEPCARINARSAATEHHHQAPPPRSLWFRGLLELCSPLASSSFHK